jgi:hypothetical protein
MSKSPFRTLIESITSEMDWEISEIDDESAVIELDAESGSEMTLYASSDEETVEFDVPSLAVMEKESDIQGNVSTFLLKRNADLRVGAWVLEEVDDGWCYSVMYNEDLEVLQKMAKDGIISNLITIVEECDRFDELWEQGEIEG